MSIRMHCASTLLVASLFLTCGLLGCSSDERAKDSGLPLDGGAIIDGGADGSPPGDAAPDLGADSLEADLQPQVDAGTHVCAVERFDNLGTFEQATLQQGDVTITASDVISVLNNAGLGVTDHLIDGSEWMHFALATPQLGVSYVLSGGGGPTGSVGATTLEAFDAQGNSLGTKDVVGTRMQYVSEHFNHVPISAFKIQARDGGSVRVRSLATHCCKIEQAFDTLGDQSSATLDLAEVRVTASASITLKNGVGLGVSGGDDEMIDTDEWVHFAIVRPAIRVSYHVSAASTDYVDVSIESFDEGGTSLGAKTPELVLDDDVGISGSTYDKISAFKVQGDGSGTGHSIGSLVFWNDCQ